MKKYRSILSIVCVALALFPTLAWSAPPGELSTTVITNGWEMVATGIDYQEFFLPGDPNHVFVTRMDRNNPQVTLESSIGLGRLSGGVETVSNMFRRYDQALSYWGETTIPHDNGAWGGRNQAVVAINGYFYDPATGIPWRGQVHSGWYAKRFDDLQNGSGFAWTLERDAFIGECIKHVDDKQVVKFFHTGKTINIDGINVARGAEQLILYTPQYDANTLTDSTGVEVVVEMDRPTLILPLPNSVTGTIRQIRKYAGATPLPFDTVVLSGKGQPATRLINNARVGDQVGISQEIKSYNYKCQDILPLDWTKTFASIGGSFYFLKDGQIQTFDDTGANIRNPRTAIAYNDQYIFFIVVDGRDALNSRGMTMTELGTFARDVLAARYGINQDGGGSSTMVVNGQVMNNPNADLGPIYDIFLPVIRQAINLGQQYTVVAGSDPETASLYRQEATAKTERAVANGMLMVAIQPEQYSTKFTVGETVLTTGSDAIPLRLGPGTNYAILTHVAPGTAGQVVQHANQLNGVLAKGAYWWLVKIGSTTGWIAEDMLALQP